jgi:hypothetical protein
MTKDEIADYLSGRAKIADACGEDEFTIPNEIGLEMAAFLRGESEPTCPHCREVYDIWAGIEGFVPKTAPEAYQQRIIDQMREAAAKGVGL